LKCPDLFGFTCNRLSNLLQLSLPLLISNPALVSTMGAISAPSRILVTGANGFIASHCVADLLASSFTVVGTVRNEEKKSRVLRVHKNHPNLEIAIVPDLTVPTAFDEAIGGCDGVLHLAAPFNFSYSNFETEMLIPSIDGSKAICLAATKEKRVQRVVITSSVAAVYDSSRGLDPGKVWTEKSWAPLSYEDGKNAAAAPIAYRASKVLGEKTAWEFLKENHPQWDLATLCPGMVFGKLLDGSIDSVKELNTSNQIIWGMLDKEEVTPTRAPCQYSSPIPWIISREERATSFT
jgi:nucleoside-diphosphate-sugar epimerase